ncbi:bifunctional heptose 7-phosphate kinase/heptose 1-phosphate adenyltransferase, partial [Salmonella enterica]
FAKRQGDILVVGVNTDESIKRLKGESRPINELYDRRIMLAALACVDFVTHFGEDTPKELIAKLRPNVVVKGGQYAVEDV